MSGILERLRKATGPLGSEEALQIAHAFCAALDKPKFSEEWNLLYRALRGSIDEALKLAVRKVGWLKAYQIMLAAMASAMLAHDKEWADHLPRHVLIALFTALESEEQP